MCALTSSCCCSAELQPQHSILRERHIYIEYGLHEKIMAARSWSGRCASCNTLLQTRNCHPCLIAGGGVLFCLLDYPHKVDSCGEIDGTKLPRGRHYAPIIRPCRSRINNTAMRGEISAMPCRNDELGNKSRLNAWVAKTEKQPRPSGRKSESYALLDYRMTASSLQRQRMRVGNHTDSTVILCISARYYIHSCCMGVKCFQPLSSVACVISAISGVVVYML